MTLIRRQPSRSMPLRDAFDMMLSDPWSGFMGDGERWGSGGMPIDVRETDEGFVIEAEMPGMRPEDTEVTLDGRTLTIQGHFGEQRHDDEGKGERYLVRERRSGSMVRSVTFPIAVDADKVSCTFEHGELKVTVPKAAESRARKIPITEGSGKAKQVGSGSGS